MAIFDKSTDRVVSRFNYARLVSTTTLPIIAVYKHPEDYPDKYVARAFDLQQPTNLVAVADDYDGILGAIPTGDMVRLERSEKDDPAIVETWI